MRLLAQMQFGPYAPDQPDLGNPGLELARNVLPRARGYDSLPQTVEYSPSQMDSRALGAGSARDETTSYLYAGDAGKLYSLSGGTWNDVSRVSAYTAATRWEFARWADTMMAASVENPLQVITLGAANFADLVADVNAGTFAVVRNFVMGAYINDTDGLTPERVRWSALGDPSDWTPSASTQAGLNDLRSEGGRCQRLVGGEYAVLFQERSIYRISYTGGATVWQFDEVDPGIGTPSPGSVVRHGLMTFFLAEDGFRVTDGGMSRAIGEERVDLHVLSDLDPAHVDRVTSAVYTDEQIIVWGYPGAGNTDGSPNRLAIYNYGTDRWAIGDEAVDILFQAATPYTSPDDMDSLYASIDAVPGSLDDHVWGGGTFEIGAIDTGRRLRFFNGPSRAAQFETGEHQLTPGRRTFVSECRSLANLAGGVEVEIGHRNRQQDPIVWTPASVPNSDGIVPFRIDNRYQRYRVTLRDGFDHAVGLDVYGEPSGGR